MKWIEEQPDREVDFHGLTIGLMKNEKCAAVDEDGELWVFDVEIETATRSWLGIPDVCYPRLLGRIDLEGMNWKETKVEYK
ncbi:MAG: hypothetical protein HRT88_07190 [Lentisphaeraceae bacterium]|nr:hypothetical protein [Lentisphaeraceae bacterium]